jgi:polyhydroxyalkanoate synthesis regulator phasin
MEAAIPVLILDFIISYALEEITDHMLKSGCMWSKRKWRKIMKKINKHKSERPKEIARRISKMDSEAQINIMDYVIKLEEEVKKFQKETAI